MSMFGRTTVCEPAVRPAAPPCTRAAVASYQLAIGPEVDDWAVDEQLAELGRVLRKRIGALAATMAGVWGGLVTADRARLRHRLAVGRAEARDLGAARNDGVAIMSLVRWRPALGRDVLSAYAGPGLPVAGLAESAEQPGDEVD